MAAKRQDLVPTRYSLLSRLEHWNHQQSWKGIFDTYWRLIYTMATTAGLNDSEAQDVVQGTVICMVQDIEKFRAEHEPQAFKGWLRKIIQLRIADQWAKRAPATSVEPQVGPAEHGHQPTAETAAGKSQPDLDILDSTFDVLWEDEWHENLLHAATDRVKHQVKEEQFQMYDLYAVKKWPVSKVADTFGVSSTTVFLSKHRVGSLIKKEIHHLKQHLF